MVGFNSVKGLKMPPHIWDRDVYANIKIESYIKTFGCVLWLDANDITGIASGGDLETWPARVGVDPTQPTSTKRPEYSANGWNGSPCVLFDNVGEALECTFDLSGTPAATLIIAAHSDGAASAAFVFEYGQNVISDRGIVMYFNSQSPYVMSAQNGVTSRKEDSASVGSRRVVFGGVFDSSVSPNVTELWKADTPTVAQVTSFSANVDTTEPPTNYNANQAWIGSRNNGAALPLNGSVREILLIPSRVSNEEMQELMEAMAMKGTVI